MKIIKTVDLGEYTVVIEYEDNGSGHIKVAVNDELGEEIENIEIINDEDPDGTNEVNPNLN